MYNMNVKELKKLLVDIPDNVQVIMSTDSEGNSYRPMSDVPMYPAKYIARRSWEGDVYDPTDSDEEEQEYCQDPKAIDAIVLYPIN